MVDEITSRTGHKVRRAAVYTTLQRLVTTWLGESRPERGGKAQRHVRLEPAGLAATAEARAALENMWGGLDPMFEES